MKFKRSSGIILHPTCLPGPYGIGDIGPAAYRWVDFLAQTGCNLWQVLPLGPTGYGDSPYQCFSAFAGNPYLISPELLVEEGFLQLTDLVGRPNFPSERVDYGEIIPWKLKVLDRSYEYFERKASTQIKEEMAIFLTTQAVWLEDFALFMALKEAHGGAPWFTWEPALRDREPQALEEAHQINSLAIWRQVFRQFVFFRQWKALRAYAAQKGIQIIGDIPIFVAHDSADVWAHRELFYLDEQGQPTVVAGVPPDYFSATGQLWGNPLYRWNIHKANNYTWWFDRIRAVLELVDIIRIDHFRGFAAYWEVTGGAPTAEKGRWVPGPGKVFFRALKSALGELPIIAEDLGVITPDVEDLRDIFGLPGMKVLQFAFGALDPDHDYLPHNYPPNCVVYTGTHDNDTIRGWYEHTAEIEKDFIRRYVARDGHDISWDMVRAAWSSVAVFALAPMQDLLGLGNEARMNYPGNPSGNWSWRMPENAYGDMMISRMQDQNFLYGRNASSVAEHNK